MALDQVESSVLKPTFSIHRVSTLHKQISPNTLSSLAATIRNAA